MAALPLGCGSEENPPGTPTVAATTGIAADLATAVAGPDAEVVQVVPDAASPHDFQLSAQDRQRLEEAELVVAVGSGLEAGIPLEEVGSEVWELTDHAGELLPFADGGADPHVWMDPRRVAAAAPALAAALTELEPEAAAGFEERAGDLAAELRAADRELEATLASVPAADRELVTSHDSLAYFARRYDFEVVATAFPATGPEAEPSAARLEDVASAIAERDVAAVFAGREDDPQALALVAEQAGVEVESGLAIESPAELGDLATMLRHDGELIAAALTSGG